MSDRLFTIPLYENYGDIYRIKEKYFKSILEIPLKMNNEWLLNNGHYDLVRRIYELKDCKNMLYHAIIDNDVELFKYLYNIGYSITTKHISLIICHDRQEMYDYLIFHYCV